MRICIAHGGDLGDLSGGTDRITAFSAGLADAGHDVTIVAPRPTDGLPERLRHVNVETVPISAGGTLSQPLRASIVSRRAQRIANGGETHLQIEHSSQAGIATLLGSSNFVLDMHDLVYPSPQYASVPFSTLVRRFIHYVEKQATLESLHVIVVSTPMKRVLVNDWGIDEQKVTIIPNGFTPSALERFKGHEEQPGRVGFIGTLHPKLDLQTFVDVAKLNEVEEVFIIGDGEARTRLQQLVDENGVDNVTLTGRLPHDEAFGLLASSQVVIYPIKQSLHTEMLSSRKIFDYAALGKAMVIDDVSESEVWREFKSNRAALFASPNDNGDFLAKVRTLLHDRELRRSMCERAEELSTKYTWANQVDDLVELYDELDS